MNILPAILLFDVNPGLGGIAFSEDGTLLASVDMEQHCVNIYGVNCAGTRTGAPLLVIGSSGTPGQFGVCFVKHTNNVLIAEAGNDRVVEVSAVTGVCVRCIAMGDNVWPVAVAYCGIRDVIAVSLFRTHEVVLLQYASAAVMATIGSVRGSGDGQLTYPRGVTFILDGAHVLVADCYNDRVSKFDAATGAFVAHVATKAANGIDYPSDVLQCEDGSIVVAQLYAGSRNVVCVREGGATAETLEICNGCSLAHISLASAVAVKCSDGNVFVLRDAWTRSSRRAWLSALCDVS